MKPLHIRVEKIYAISLRKIQREYKKKSGLKLSLNVIGNRAVALGHHAAAKQLNIKP